MKVIALAILTLLLAHLTGCATRLYYPNGQKAVETRGDATDFHFKGGGVELAAATLNHSAPTKAAANGITSGLTAAGAAAAGLR